MVLDMNQTLAYTRTGDDGTTALIDGERLSKLHERIEAYGTVEELNAFIGLTLEYVRQSPPTVMYRLAPALTRVQNELLNMQSELATPLRLHQSDTPVVTAEHVLTMERLINRCNEELPPHKGFALPGGGLVGATLHVCRAVCRRAERDVLRLAQKEPVRPQMLTYLNRLSDLLFVLSRFSQIHSGEPELLWDPDGQQD